MHSRSSHFPIILTLLTVVLAIFMILSFVDRLPQPQHLLRWNRIVPQVSEEDYARNMEAVLLEHSERFSSALTFEDQQVWVNKTLGRLLSVRVPADYRDFHLEVVVHLNSLRDKLTQARTLLEDPDFSSFIAQVPWK